MDEREWKLIWTPPYMPTFQPIGLFWQHGKQYVSFYYNTGRKRVRVWGRALKERYGDAKWRGQDGG